MTFIDPNAKVPFEIDPQNTLFLRQKMSLKVQAAVQNELLQLQVQTKTGSGQATMFGFGANAQKLAVLKHNVVGWRGPLFEDEKGNPVPCTAENIENLDPDEPWLVDALNRIDELNAPRVEKAGATVLNGKAPNFASDTSTG